MEVEDVDVVGLERGQEDLQGEQVDDGAEDLPNDEKLRLFEVEEFAFCENFAVFIAFYLKSACT